MSVNRRSHRGSEGDEKASWPYGCGTGVDLGAPDLPKWAVDVRHGVTTILVMSNVLPLAEVKAKFSEMVDRVEHQHDRITVTRNGRPAAVLMSADDLAALEDTLELLSDPAAMAEIEQARREVVAGNTVSADEIRAKYLHQ